MEQIHALVKELAIYEREPEAVITTPALYRKDFTEGKFDALVAEADGAIIGTAIYYIGYSTWKGNFLWLEDFVVRQEMRGGGTGKLLFEEVVRIAGTYNTFFKWQVLDWNASALHFYAKFNYTQQKEWITCRMEIV